MKCYLGLALLISLTSCADVRPQTAPQAAYEGTASFVAALKAANTYSAMPRCSATVKPPCSEQTIVNQLVKQANRADAAVISAQTTSKNIASTATDREKANAAAAEAVALLEKLVPAN